MNISQSHNRTQTSVQKYNVSRNGNTRGDPNTGNTSDTVNFSFEANLLYELIGNHGYIQDRLVPWYFPEAYLVNAETALDLSSTLVRRAQKTGLPIDLNFMFEEIKKLNGIFMEDNEFTCHSKELAEHMEKSEYTDFKPASILSNEDKQVLKLLHQFIAGLGENTISYVEDFALLYALEKQKNEIQLIPQTAKYIVDKYIDIIDPRFVPMLIDFYVEHKPKIKKS